MPRHSKQSSKRTSVATVVENGMVVISGKQHPNIVRDGEKAMNDVIIIGAGPAGLSASISCARFGLKVLVIDEFMKPGGRLLDNYIKNLLENGGTG